MSVPYEDVQALFNVNADLKKLAEDAYNAYIGLRNDFKGKLEEVKSILKEYEEKIEMLTEANQDLKKELADANATISNLRKEEEEFKTIAGIQYDGAIAKLHQNEAKRAESENGLAISSTAVSDFAQQLEQKELQLEQNPQKIDQLEEDAIFLKNQLDSAKSDAYFTANEEDLKFKLQLAHQELYKRDEEWKTEYQELKRQVKELTEKLEKSETSRKRSVNESKQNDEELDQPKENDD